MKLNVIGIKRIKGDKSKAGNPYDICSLFAMTPIELVSNDKMSITGKGFELTEMPLDPASIENFQKVDFPAVLEIHTEPQPRFGKFETVAVGFTPAPALKSA